MAGTNLRISRIGALIIAILLGVMIAGALNLSLMVWGDTGRTGRLFRGVSVRMLAVLYVPFIAVLLHALAPQMMSRFYLIIPGSFAAVAAVSIIGLSVGGSWKLLTPLGIVLSLALAIGFWLIRPRSESPPAQIAN